MIQQLLDRQFFAEAAQRKGNQPQPHMNAVVHFPTQNSNSWDEELRNPWFFHPKGSTKLFRCDDIWQLLGYPAAR